MRKERVLGNIKGIEMECERQVLAGIEIDRHVFS
jgi:hypothetical protein